MDKCVNALVALDHEGVVEHDGVQAIVEPQERLQTATQARSATSLVQEISVCGDLQWDSAARQVARLPKHRSVHSLHCTGQVTRSGRSLQAGGRRYAFASPKGSLPGGRDGHSCARPGPMNFKIRRHLSPPSWFPGRFYLRNRPCGRCRRSCARPGPPPGTRASGKSAAAAASAAACHCTASAAPAPAGFRCINAVLALRRSPRHRRPCTVHNGASQHSDSTRGAAENVEGTMVAWCHAPCRTAAQWWPTRPH